MGPKPLKEQLERCKHFTGLLNDACRAGVRYDDVKGPPDGKGWAFTLPCLGQCDTCPARVMPTAAEIEAEEREIEAAVRRTFAARDAIGKAAGNRRGIAGQIPCPVCGTGQLAYAVKANGHVWAKCDTAGCVGWVE